ncbi:beta-hexosaminidase 1-like [Hevea brasiliensis]|uniref:beta-hexosaminidase 1-like n=1 Tax=Hevea brasiliensis TaxID=3981 RepID=UPI0025F02FCE|nr:beta-hexosaminidase 1-like [Hevea brasiliensis]
MMDDGLHIEIKLQDCDLTTKDAYKYFVHRAQEIKISKERSWSRREAISSRNITLTALPILQYFRCLLNRRGVEAAPVANFYARQSPIGLGLCYEQ